METEKKTKPNKANFKAQTTLKEVKRKIDTGFLRPDGNGREMIDDGRSSIIPHQSSFRPLSMEHPLINRMKQEFP